MRSYLYRRVATNPPASAADQLSVGLNAVKHTCSSRSDNVGRPFTGGIFTFTFGFALATAGEHQLQVARIINLASN